MTGFLQSVFLLLAFRFILGVTEGVYWPQQSRFARAWFSTHELTRANSIIQYYGQFMALALGFIILTPVYDAFGWRVLFYIGVLPAFLGVVVAFKVPESPRWLAIKGRTEEAAAVLKKLGATDIDVKGLQSEKIAKQVRLLFYSKKPI